jgi:hypothetical protein
MYHELSPVYDSDLFYVSFVADCLVQVHARFPLMLKIFLIALAGMLLLTGQRASAKDGPANCEQDFTECMARARTLVNDIEVSDAQAACTQLRRACKNKAEEVLQQEQENPKEPAAEPQGNDTVNGNIKEYRFEK